MHNLVWSLVHDAGPWTLVDFLAAIVPTGTSTDGRRTWRSLGDLTSGEIDGLLGLERVLDQCQGAAEPTGVGADIEKDTSFEGRRRHALTAIAQLQTRRNTQKGAGVDPA